MSLQLYVCLLNRKIPLKPYLSNLLLSINKSIPNKNLLIFVGPKKPNIEYMQAKYRLGKKVLESTPVSSTYNIQDSITQQIWKAKVFDLTKIHQYDMLNALQYNEQVFSFLKDKYENSLYFQKAFQKDTKEFMVFEFWEERLSDYIMKHSEGIKDQLEVKKILQDVLMSICDIYAESYMILNLRPEHIVRIHEPSENSLGWKIQSLVFDYQTHGLSQQCEYEFNYLWASNQEKSEKENLDDTLKDQQIVWYMGILALRLIYGPKFKIGQKFKDSNLNLSELSKICLSEIYELIQKSVKANLRDRIPLKKFLNLPVFSRVEISSDVKNKFISGNSDRIKKSSILKSSILQKSIIRKNSDSFKMTISSRIQLPITSINDPSIGRTRNAIKSPVLSQVKAQKIFNELRWVLEKCLFMGEIKDYTQTSASLSETSVEDKTLIRYIYFKIGQINLQKFKEMILNDQNLKLFRQSANSKDLYQDLLSDIQQNARSKQKKSVLDQALEYESKMRKLDPNHLKLLSDFKYIASNLKKGIQSKKINLQELVDYFPFVTGKFFSSLKKSIQSQYGIDSKGIKVRALSYFIISSYIVLVKPFLKNDEEELVFLLKNDFAIYKKKFYEPKRLQGSIHVKFADQIDYIRICEFTKTAEEDPLIQNSNILLQNNQQPITKQNAPKITSILHVPERKKN